MANLKIYFPYGATGPSSHDTLLSAFLRELAATYAAETGEPVGDARKYGVNVRTDKFVMHQFCWCDKDDCPYCLDEDLPIPDHLATEYGIDRDNDRAAPNFWYRPLDYKVWWYKYIGRSVKENKILTRDELEAMSKDLGLII